MLNYGLNNILIIGIYGDRDLKATTPNCLIKFPVTPCFFIEVLVFVGIFKLLFHSYTLKYFSSPLPRRLSTSVMGMKPKKWLEKVVHYHFMCHAYFY